jgi:hypothetical protein
VLSLHEKFCSIYGQFVSQSHSHRRRCVVRGWSIARGWSCCTNVAGSRRCHRRRRRCARVWPSRRPHRPVRHVPAQESKRTWPFVSKPHDYFEMVSYILLPAGKTVCEVMLASPSILIPAARIVICCLALSFMTRRSFLRSTCLPLYVITVDLPALARVCKISTMANFFAAGMLFFIFHFLLM